MRTEIIQTDFGKHTIYIAEEKGLPQLFCVHGGMGLGSDSLIKGLLPLSQIFDLIFIDLRGCGNSNRPSNDSYHLSDFSHDIIQIVKAKRNNNNKQIGIFGHSLGGMIAINILATNKSIFSFAILSNSALDDKWREHSRNAVKSIYNPNLENALQHYSENPNSNEILRELAIEYGPIYFPELTNEESKKYMTQFSYRADAMDFTGNYVYPNMDLTSDVKAIEIPILVIGGSRDVVVPLFCQKKLVNTLSDGTLAIIQETGHFPFITQNQFFYNAVSQWWEIYLSRPI